MDDNVKTVTVYAASSSQIDRVYHDAAEKLGELLARHQITCINGAGKKGLMGALNESVLARGGKVCGVIPRFMVDEGWGHDSLSEQIVTETMHERKEIMARMSDGCIALPGGVGTMEELLEIITWRQLGLYSRPIVILNVNGYYQDLLAMLDKAASECFIHSKHTAIWHVAETPEEALGIILEQPQWENNPRSFAAL
ncbi:TIGR00730 family Rossman fold protein [Bacteroidales bacterium OttesenSCG-928-A17]|nr:TIGR00730 family Rossman fold protein [Bacteroidales bacterium OttesenSCG-928-A17]